MIRIVIQRTPNLFNLAAYPADEKTLTQTFEYEGETYYRAQSTSRWVLYKKAVSGWGAGGSFDPRQR